MKRSKEALLASPVCDAQTLGIRNTEPHVHHVVVEFLKTTRVTAMRWTQMQKGILLLAIPTDDRAAGAIFLYDREARQFYRLYFASEQTPLVAEELEPLARKYKLVRYAENPALLKARIRAAKRLSDPVAGTAFPAPESTLQAAGAA